MDSKEIDILLQMEALICEREGMVAENHGVCVWTPAKFYPSLQLGGKFYGTAFKLLFSVMAYQALRLAEGLDLRDHRSTDQHGDRCCDHRVPPF